MSYYFNKSRFEIRLSCSNGNNFYLKGSTTINKTRTNYTSRGTSGDMIVYNLFKKNWLKDEMDSGKKGESSSNYTR